MGKSKFLRRFLRLLEDEQQRLALRVLGIYLAAGTLWILLSDRILYSVLGTDVGAPYQTLKGAAFIAVTGIVLHYFIKKALGEISLTHVALLESEERFHNFMDHAPMAVFLRDSDGRYAYVNSEFASFVGKKTQEVNDKMLSDIWPPDVAQRLEDHDRKVLQGRTRLEVVEELPRADGKLFRCRIFKFPLVDARNNAYVAGFVVLDDRAEEANYRSDNAIAAGNDRVTQ